MKKVNPFPTMIYNGNVYKLRDRKTQIPDFTKMSNIEVSIWLIHNTWAKGYQKAPNPLIGLGISVN